MSALQFLPQHELFDKERAAERVIFTSLFKYDKWLFRDDKEMYGGVLFLLKDYLK